MPSTLELLADPRRAFAPLSDFAHAMSTLASGVVLVTSRVGGRPWGTTVTAFASAGSEPRRDVTRPATTAKRTESGWTVSGHKVFCTMAPAADVLYTAARCRSCTHSAPTARTPSSDSLPRAENRVFTDDMAPPIEQRVLRLERTFPARLAAVYRALTDPEKLAKWWGPRGFAAPNIDFDPQVGARYRIAMQPPGGDLFHLSGVFREVQPPSRLVYTFRWEPPHPDDRETLVTLSLQDRGERTDLLLTQGRFATQDRRALHEAGWTESFDRLVQLFGNASE